MRGSRSYRTKQRRPDEILGDFITDAQLVAGAAHSSTGMPSAELQALQTMADGDVIDALQALPQAQRIVVFYADVEGFHYKEIAAILGCPLGTVMSRLHRGRCSLRKLLVKTATGQRCTRNSTMYRFQRRESDGACSIGCLCRRGDSAETAPVTHHGTDRPVASQTDVCVANATEPAIQIRLAWASAASPRRTRPAQPQRRPPWAATRPMAPPAGHPARGHSMLSQGRPRRTSRNAFQPSEYQLTANAGAVSLCVPAPKTRWT